MNRILTLNLAALLVSILIGGCGSFNLSAGTTTAPNDPTPTGTIVAQGQFFGQNGQTVSGTATIYLSGSAYILSIQGITAPSESGLLVQVIASPSGTILNTTLRATSGNQNYSLTEVSYGIVFNTVNIYSSITQKNYGAAQLEQSSRR